MGREATDVTTRAYEYEGAVIVEIRKEIKLVVVGVRLRLWGIRWPAGGEGGHEKDM